MNKRIILSVILILLAVLPTMAAKEKMEYTIEGAGVAVEGTYLVKVTIVSKQPTVTDDLLRRCAIHGVLFKGFKSVEHRQDQRPMASDAQAEKQRKDFYEPFLNSDLTSFAATIDGSRLLMKQGRKYHVSAVVQVFKDRLYQHLVKNGVIKGLDQHFE